MDGLRLSFLRPLLWQFAKTMGSEGLATGRNILTDTADPNAKLRDVVRSNLSESAHRVIEAKRAGTQT